jgi:adenylate cyclase
MRISISIKYSVLILFTIFITSIPLSLYFLDYFKEEIRSQLLMRGQTITRQLAQSCAPLLLSKDMAKINAAINSALKDPDIIAASITDHENVIVADHSPEKVGQTFSDQRLSNKKSNSAFHFEDIQANEIIFTHPASFGGVYTGQVIVHISRSVLDKATSSTSRQVLYMTGIIACFVVAISLLMLRRTLRPLGSVLQATKQISEGDFSTRVKIKSNDEIGELAREFNKMAARAELFFRYLDKSIAERLAEDESLAQPGGNLKPVSVLFGDMRNFTSLSNLLSPSQVVRILNTYFDLFIRIVYHYHGVVDKTMGDAIMAFFEPAKSKKIDHTRNAALAAVSMRAAVWALNGVIGNSPEHKTSFLVVPQNFGFAVATGRLIVGNIGSKRRMDYTVCGPAVNLAARLQDETPNGEVVFDRFTAMDVEDLMVCQELDRVLPKGFLPGQEVTPAKVISVSETEMQNIRRLISSLFTSKFFKKHVISPSAPNVKQIAEMLQDRSRDYIGQDPPEFLIC